MTYNVFGGTLSLTQSVNHSMFGFLRAAPHAARHCRPTLCDIVPNVYHRQRHNWPRRCSWMQSGEQVSFHNYRLTIWSRSTSWSLTSRLENLSSSFPKISICARLGSNPFSGSRAIKFTRPLWSPLPHLDLWPLMTCDTENVADVK